MNTIQDTPLLENDQCEALIELMRAELQEYGALLNLLDDQQEAIRRRSAPQALITVSEKVASQFEVTMALFVQREKLVKQSMAETGLDQPYSIRRLIEFFPKNTQGLIKALVDEVTGLVTKVHNRARQNQLMSLKFKEVTEELIEALSGKKKTKVYGPTGGGEIKVAIGSGYMNATA